MPNETYICTLYLPKSKRAIAYQLDESDSQSTEKSVIKIFHAEKVKPLHEIEHAGKIKNMRWVKKDLFAVATEARGEILLYNYQRGALVKTLSIPLSDYHQYSTLTISSSYLVSSTYEGLKPSDAPNHVGLESTTYLHVYDTEKFSYKRIQVEGAIVSQTALTISNHLLFCEISGGRIMVPSRVHSYNLETGTFLGQIGGRLTLWYGKPFVEILNNDYLFRTHVSPLCITRPLKQDTITKCFLYKLYPPSKTVAFQIRCSPGSFFCPLPQGGIAVVPRPEEKSESLSIYHPLESTIPVVITSEEPLELKTPEDVTFFIATKELPRLTTEVGSIADALRKLSLFPEPLEKLVTAYSLSSEAQEEIFVDEIVESNWPKPQ